MRTEAKGASEPLYKALRDAWKQPDTMTLGWKQRRSNFLAKMQQAADRKQCNLCRKMWSPIGLGRRGPRFPG